MNKEKVINWVKFAICIPFIVWGLVEQIIELSRGDGFEYAKSNITAMAMGAIIIFSWQLYKRFVLLFRILFCLITVLVLYLLGATISIWLAIVIGILGIVYTVYTLLVCIGKIDKTKTEE